MFCYYNYYVFEYTATSHTSPGHYNINIQILYCGIKAELMEDTELTFKAGKDCQAYDVK